MTFTQRLLNLVAAGIAAALPFALYAQEYPVRPIRLIVPFPAGGPMDILSRSLGERLAASLGKPIIVDNRGGASGTIGAELVARAAPDGYTLLAGHSGTHVVNVSLFPRLPYDPLKDFAPITLTATTPMTLVVTPSLPVRSVADLIALAKQKPGQLNYATASSGGPTHMVAVMLQTLAGIDIVHVPYNGNSPGLTDVMAGRVQLMFSNLTTAMPLVRSGRLRALAVTPAKRTPQAPDLPTVAESGPLPGYDFKPWFAMFAPAATPPALVKRLTAEIKRALEGSEMQSRFASQAMDLTTCAPEELAAQIRREIPLWRDIVKKSGATAG